MTDGVIISVYGSHNATVAMYHDGEYHVVELERWLNRKNSGLNGYLPTKYPQKVFDDVMEYLLNKAGTRKIKLFLSNYFVKIDLSRYDIDSIQRFDHHASHAACAFYQSDYEKSLIFTYDGGGNGAFFNVYLAESRSRGPTLIDRFDLDLGFPYMILADHLSDIRKDPLNIGNLVYAGKLMGLCAYGKAREDWLPHFENFYREFRYGGDSFVGGAEKRVKATHRLFSAIGVNMNEFNIEETRFDGEFAWDIAATSQRAFENIFLELATPYLEKYHDLPVCLSGGCALNVILNSKLLKSLSHTNVFVPPNVNDCGIAVGGLLEYLKPSTAVDLTYSGLPILDQINYTSLVESNPVSVIDDITVSDIAELLSRNVIVGVIHGNSEHGPRALGNRSILCNPVGDMKDVLNEKVKDREWYRPFAPVVRLEDVSKYFEFNAESRHMTFIAKVKDDYEFPAITHVDGTGRLQTVTRNQNHFLYDIISEFKERTGYGVILNTSFNVNGKPILTRLSDAFEILLQTDLDCVYYDEKIICKTSKEREIRDIIRNENISRDHTKHTVYVLAYTDSDDEFKAIADNIDYFEQRVPNLTVILNERHQSLLTFKPETNTVFMGPRHIFYQDMIGGAGFAGKELDFIKPLWVKDIIDENHFKSDYHLVVDLMHQKSVDFFNTFYTKYMKQSDIVDKIVIGGSTDISNITIVDYLQKRDNYGASNGKLPEFGFYTGYTDTILWLVRTYEGHLRYHILNGRGSLDRDYLSIQFLENESNFLMMD